MGAAERLAATDPLPTVVAWLSGHAAVTARLGGSGRVGAYSEPPFPRLRVTDVPGGTDDLTLGRTGVRVQLEALGRADGGPGKEALRAILYAAVGALAELPGASVPAGGPVIVGVEPSQAGGFVPEPGGRPRYLTVVTVWVMPADG